MSQRMRYSVVGIRENGDRVVITRHFCQEVAGRVIEMIRSGSTYKDLVVDAETLPQEAAALATPPRWRRVGAVPAS